MSAVFRRILLHIRRQLKMDVTDRPIVVVLGSTGAGKSKLAIEVAEEFDGEIISADSMQVYKGLDIISNKVTPQEQEQVRHHMIDVVEPTTNYSVVKFRDACLKIISELHSRGRLPVVVGGTNYYIEAVLWRLLVDARRPEGDAEGPDRDGSPGGSLDLRRPEGDGSPERPPDHSWAHWRAGSTEDSADVTGGRPGGAVQGPPSAAPDGSPFSAAEDPPSADADRRRLERLSTEELYSQLREKDPEQAQVLHPNERRKILRSLEVTLRSGRPMSEHLRLQRSAPGGGSLGGPLRFPRACLLWVTAEQETLDRRLDARVEGMLRRGLVEELAEFHRRYNAARLREGATPDYTRGIFQSIGFKEFHGYLTRSPETGESESERLLTEGVERLKLVTRRYARKQTRWVRQRFLSAGREAPPLYRLDATDPALWEERVRRPAVGVVRAWLEGRTPELEPESPLCDDPGDRHTTFHCAVCGVYTSGARQREAHLQSRRHRRAVQGLKRRRQRDGEGEGDAKRAAVQGADGNDTCGGEQAVMERGQGSADTHRPEEETGKDGIRGEA